MGAAVQPVYLFDLAFQRAQWLSARQATVAENVANANSPNFRARDIEPFEAILDRTALEMNSTRPGHISLAGAQVHTSPKSRTWDVTSNGNDVSLEKELIKAGEVTRDYSLTVAIVKSFHRIWMAGVRG